MTWQSQPPSFGSFLLIMLATGFGTCFLAFLVIGGMLVLEGRLSLDGWLPLALQAGGIGAGWGFLCSLIAYASDSY